MSLSRIGTLNYEERRNFIEREAECHFENLKEVMKNNASKSALRMFASSLKQSVKCLHELDKVCFQEKYHSRECNSNLKKVKRERFENLLKRYERANDGN